MSDTTRAPNYCKAGDIWSLGCVFVEMVKGTPLFTARDKTSLLSQIFTISDCKPTQADCSRFPILNSVQQTPKTISLEDIVKPVLPSEGLELLKDMLAFDPAKRITAVEALQHKFFVGANFRVDVHRTCPLASELVDEQIPNFVNDFCGGL